MTTVNDNYAAAPTGFLERDGVNPDGGRLAPAVNGIYDMLRFPGNMEKRAGEMYSVAWTARDIAGFLFHNPGAWLRNEGDLQGYYMAVNAEGEGDDVDVDGPENPAKMTARGLITRRLSERQALILEVIAEWTLLRYEWECENAPETYAVESTKFPHNPDALISDCVDPKRWWNSDDAPTPDAVRNNVLHGGVLDLWNDEEWDEGDSVRHVSEVAGLFVDAAREARAVADAMWDGEEASGRM